MSEQTPDLIRCIIVDPQATTLTAVQSVHVNGQSFPIKLNTPFTIEEAGYDALLASTYDVRILPAEDASPGEPGADGAAAEGPGGDDGGGDGFDPEAVIVGSIKDIEPRLAALTSAQLALVEAAEADREVPRKGIAELIAKAREAQSTPPATQE